MVKIENIDLFNPSQYITKNGVVSPGSSGRYHVEFRLQDDTHIELSVSAKQAGKFESGMRNACPQKKYSDFLCARGCGKIGVS